MSTSTDRRVGRRRRNVVGAVGAATALALCGVVAAPASAAQVPANAHVASLVGAWQLQGTDNGNPVSPRVYFHRNHTLDFLPPDNSFDGTGSWREKRNGEFTFNQAHYIDDSSGNPVSWITADVSGTTTGDQLTGGGIAKLYDLKGNVLAVYVVKFQGDKTSCDDQPPAMAGTN